MPSRSCPVCGSSALAPYRTPYPDPLVRCRGCGTRFVHPAPDDAALRARYEAEHGAGKWSALFGAADPADAPRRARLLAELAGGAAGRRLLDVGCGDGRFLDAAAAAGWRPLGFELSHAALRAVRARHPAAVATTAALRPAARLAAITFWDVLEHLPDPAAAVRAAAAALAPGGLIAASMPNAAGAEALLRGRAWRYHDLAAYGHLVHLGPRQLERLFRAPGLACVHVETRGSVDLRDLVAAPAATPGRALVWMLDRASGALARVAEPARRGNTLLVVARRAGRVRCASRTR
jgi:2-polyprenyl-3-methyl-5-hydroxy-6-metoxy-1,4-benzoquinol methylase